VRRATAALLGTVVGTTLLVGAKYATSPATTEVSAATDPVGDAPAGTTPEASSPDASSVAAPLTAAPTSTAAATKASGTAPANTARTTPTSTAPAPASAACTKVQGNAVNVPEPGTGTVTVSVSVCNKAISSAAAALSRSNYQKNSSAIPALNAMVVRYYKTGISQIHYSGATLTSGAYQSSLRSAMSKAGI
jgi:hypothetical protein